MMVKDAQRAPDKTFVMVIEEINQTESQEPGQSAFPVVGQMKKGYIGFP